LRGKIIRFKFFGGEYNFPKTLLKKFTLKSDKKGGKLFFYRDIAPKCPAVITPWPSYEGDLRVFTLNKLANYSLFKNCLL
jgi:hypothetical protein